MYTRPMVRLRVWVDPEIKQAIEQLVKDGHYPTINDFGTKAVQAELKINRAAGTKERSKKVSTAA